MKQWLVVKSAFFLLQSYLEKHKNVSFVIKYTVLFTILLISLASMALNRIMDAQANPFFYANF